MSRLALLGIDQAQPASTELLQQIHQAFGATPNMFRAVAHSPAALRSMWGGFAALGSGRLPARLTEQLAVAIADRNRCHYCLAAHTALGRKAGASAAEMSAAQHGHSSDPATAAALQFALQIVERRGQIDASAIDRLRAVGFDDESIVELVAHVALNLFTNYVNLVFEVPVDFPQVPLRAAA